MIIRLRIVFSLTALACCCAVGRSSADELDQHLAAGEFAAARQWVDQIPPPQRDPILAQIASAQGYAGESVAAGTTLRAINSPASRDAAIDGAAGGAGGGSFADFQSLMDLIQTTVVPDTWEALGGPSTMAPYPQGVYVDAAGTVRECAAFASRSAVDDLKSLLSGGRAQGSDEPLAWRQPAAMRCISLRRLLDEWTRGRINGTAMPEAMLQMAGLSRVEYLFIDCDDVVIAGPVGGIDTFQGWYRDRESGLTTIRFDFLQACLASTIANQPFGCTIDPSREGLQRSAQVAADVSSDKIPIGKAADAMVAALGMQRVEVFGTAGDTPIGYLMVEADRHMKQLALGVHEMPRGGASYLDVIDATIDQGPPNELLLRLWFTSAPRTIRADEDRRVFEISGKPVRLSGQNERALASGQRGAITRDFRTEMFVKSFNQDWVSIRSQYPVYGALESIYRCASVAELLQRFADSPEQRALVESLAGDGASDWWTMPTPRQVESIAIMHRVRKGRTRHNVVVASGGVSVDSRQTLTSKIVDYPSLGSIARPSASQPKLVQRWWWDARL